MFDNRSQISQPKRVFGKSEPAVGVDIGDYAVKICQIVRADKKFKLTGLGYSKINPLSPKAEVEAIQDACQKARLTTKKVNAAVSPEGVIVRYLLLPMMSDAELRKAMKFEIDKYVPFGNEEVVSDYQILKVDEEKKSIKLLMVAAKKELVDARVKLLHEAGLEAQVITIDAMVLKSAFEVSYPDKKDITVGILNIGSKVTNINIIRDNHCYFMRDVQIGGESITSLIKEKLGIDADTAEQRKFALSPTDPEVFKVIEPVLGNLLNEIYLSFDYYESEYGLVVDEVYLSGGTANIKWLLEFFRENLGRPINVLAPAQNLTLDSSVSSIQLAEASPSLTVSLGLALETFN